MSDDDLLLTSMALASYAEEQAPLLIAQAHALDPGAFPYISNEAKSSVTPKESTSVDDSWLDGWRQQSWDVRCAAVVADRYPNGMRSLDNYFRGGVTAQLMVEDSRECRARSYRTDR